MLQHRVRKLNQDSARLVLLVFGLLLLFKATVDSSCITMENQHLNPSAPSLTIETFEFPDEDVLPTGYNHTLVCISNFSKANFGRHYNAQPYWLMFFFNDAYIHDCGGGDGDSEDSKVCSLVIQNATERDSGNYTCVSYNQIVCTEGTITLDFKKPSPPNFTVTPPRHINVSAGSSVDVTCEATGIPTPVIKWYKDGRLVPRENIKEVKGNSLLTLEYVTSHDQGEYWCEAHNTEGWNRSRTSLKIFSRPTILLHPKNVSVYLEDKVIVVVFTCEASGFPRPVIDWFKNNSTVTSGTVIQNGSVSSLVVHLMKSEETPGKYKCVVRNQLGEVSSKEGALVIRTRTDPQGGISSPDAVAVERTFYLHPESVEASHGENIVLTCAVEGFPVPYITWLKNGIAAVDGKAGYFQGKGSATSVLKIYSVKDRHEGRYACEATSSKRSVTSREAILSFKDGSSTSSGVSKVVWVSIVTGAVFLFVMVISIFVVRNKCFKKANFEVNEEMNEDQRFPHLHNHQETRDDQAAPRYQMTNMAIEIK